MLVKIALLPSAALATLLSQSAAGADAPRTVWLSEPRSVVKIVVGKDGGLISGPGWEHRFEPTARALDFEIAPGRRLVLRRVGDTWVGQYFHPRIRPGAHNRETHGMKFACESGACTVGQ
jgi:hypothetical protein